MYSSKICPLVLSLLFARAQPVYKIEASALRVVCVGIGRENGVFLGMLILTQARAREPNCVPGTAYCEYVLVHLLRFSFSFDSRGKNVFCCSTRSRKFKRLEPHFQTSAMRSAPKEDTESAVALAHSRDSFGGLKLHAAQCVRNPCCSRLWRRETIFTRILGRHRGTKPMTPL